MTELRVVLGDQLSLDLSALTDIRPDRDVVLAMEVMEECTYAGHHKQKIVLVLSAMRHFAETLRQRGLTVDYVSLDTPENTGSFTSEIRRAVVRHRPSRIVVTEPSEWRVQAMVEGWEAVAGVPVVSGVRDPVDGRRPSSTGSDPGVVLAPGSDRADDLGACLGVDTAPGITIGVVPDG